MVRRESRIRRKLESQDQESGVRARVVVNDEITVEDGKFRLCFVVTKDNYDISYISIKNAYGTCDDYVTCEHR